MNRSSIRVLVIDDDILKAVKIQRALEFNGVRNIEIARNQQEAREDIFGRETDGGRPDLIVTDMNYPLTPGGRPEKDAGLQLIEWMEKEQITIPVIICSSVKYHVPEILGCVWYSELSDVEAEFGKLLDILAKKDGI